MAQNYIQVDSIHDGINLRDTAGGAGFGSGECVESLGFDLSRSGEVSLFVPAGAHDLAGKVPDFSDFVDFQLIYMKGTLYVLCTRYPEGLYINGTLVSDLIDSTFMATTDGNNIYIAGARNTEPVTYTTLRYDGTNIAGCGITPPTSTPTIGPTAQKSKAVDTCESAVGWTAYPPNPPSAATITTATSPNPVQGTNCLKFDPGAVTVGDWGGTIYWAAPVKDFTTFDVSGTITPDDLFNINIWIPPGAGIYQCKIYLHTTASNNWYNQYVYSLSVTSQDTLTMMPAYGGSISDNPNSPYTVTPIGPVLGTPVPDPTDPGQPRYVPVPYQTPGPVESTNVVINTKSAITNEAVATGDLVPVTVNVESYSGAASQAFATGQWYNARIPLKMFAKMGEPGGWNSMTGMTIRCYSTAVSSAAFYVDDIKIIGGGGLSGSYYFMYGWARNDGDGNILEYSGPARDINGNLLILGPYNFDRQDIDYGTRTASTEAQVTSCVIYILGGNLSDWWVAGIIYDNTTAAGSLACSEKSLFKRMISIKSYPAAGPGDKIVWFQNRLWAIRDDRLRFSDISIDGDITPESWPVVNTVIVGSSGIKLLSITELNRLLVVRTSQGDYTCSMSNPADITTLSMTKLSAIPSVGEAVIETDRSIIYSTLAGFVENNGAVVKPLMLKAFLPIPGKVPDYKSAAYKGYEGYITFDDNVSITRLVKFDMLTGTPRVSYVDSGDWDRVQFDPKNNKTYGLLSGVIKLIEPTTANTTPAFNFMSRGYRHPGGRVVWKRLVFYCQTDESGGTEHSYTVAIYIDGVLMGSRTFHGTYGAKNEIRYDFGPFPGEYLQFRIYGTYAYPMTIYMPMRIYVDAAG